MNAQSYEPVYINELYNWKKLQDPVGSEGTNLEKHKPTAFHWSDKILTTESKSCYDYEEYGTWNFKEI